MQLPIKVLMQRGQIRPAAVQLDHQDDPHGLLVLLVRGREGKRLLHCRVLYDGLLYLEGGDGLPAAVDDLLAAARDEEEPEGVQVPDVAGGKPTCE